MTGTLNGTSGIRAVLLPLSTFVADLKLPAPTTINWTLTYRSFLLCTLSLFLISIFYSLVLHLCLFLSFFLFLPSFSIFIHQIFSTSSSDWISNVTGMEKTCLSCNSFTNSCNLSILFLTSAKLWAWRLQDGKWAFARKYPTLIVPLYFSHQVCYQPRVLLQIPSTTPFFQGDQ